jgi:beta-barrel assembly-enhancing protease
MQRLRRMRTALNILVLILVLMLSGACPVSAITIKEERELSKEFLELLKKQLPLIEDPVIVDYVNRVGQKLLAVLPPQPFEYQFYVVKQDVYNAFATPAGHIFIYSGLLAAMESEEELAGILAHEICHVVGRHISEKIERSKNANKLALAGMIAGILLGAAGAGDAGMAMMTGSAAGVQSMMLAYSRGDEEESDQNGLTTLYKAGYRGEGMVTMFEKIRSKQWFGADDIPTYVMTHPAVESRIGDVNRRVQNFNQKYGQPPLVDPMPFTRMHIRLIAEYGDENVVLHQSRQAYEKDPDNPLVNYEYGLILARTGQRQAAIKHLQKALAARPLDRDILTDLGKLYFYEGQYDQALRVLEGAVGTGSDQSEALYFMARTYQETGQLDTAVSYFEMLLDKYPDYNQAHFDLGKVYSQMGRRGEAFFHLGKYYYGKGDMQKATFQLKKALEFDQDPKQRKEVDALLAEIDAAAEETKNKKKKK